MSAASSRWTSSKSARASPAISTRCISATARSSSRAICCSPSTSGRSRTRSIRRAPISRRPRPISRFAEGDLARAKQLVRDRTITEQTFEQRTQAQRSAAASVAGQRGGGPPGRARPAVHRAACAGRRPHRRPARVARQPRHRRNVPAARTLLATIVSIDPIRFEFTFDEASYLRYERVSSGGKEVTGREGGVVVALKLLDESDFSHSGHMDFVDNVIDRSSGTIRGRAVFSNPNGVFTPGHVRAHPRAGLADVSGAAGAGRRDRHRADRASSCSWSAPTTPRRSRNTSRSASSPTTTCASSRTDFAPDDRVVVNGLMRVRPGQKVTPQEQGAPAAAPARRPGSKARRPCASRTSSSTGRSSHRSSRSSS